MRNAKPHTCTYTSYSVPHCHQHGRHHRNECHPIDARFIYNASNIPIVVSFFMNYSFNANNVPCSVYSNWLFAFCLLCLWWLRIQDIRVHSLNIIILRKWKRTVRQRVAEKRVGKKTSAQNLNCIAIKVIPHIVYRCSNANASLCLLMQTSKRMYKVFQLPPTSLFLSPPTSIPTLSRISHRNTLKILCKIDSFEYISEAWEWMNECGARHGMACVNAIQSLSVCVYVYVFDVVKNGAENCCHLKFVSIA